MTLEVWHICLGLWLAVGVGTYIARAVIQWQLFHGRHVTGLFRGFLGVPFWPVVLYVIWNDRKL